MMDPLVGYLKKDKSRKLLNNGAEYSCNNINGLAYGSQQC